MLCQAIQVPSCTFSTNMDILRPNSRYFGSIFTIFEAMGMTNFWRHFNLLYKKSCSRCEGSSHFNNCKTTRFKDKKKHKRSGRGARFGRGGGLGRHKNPFPKGSVRVFNKSTRHFDLSTSPTPKNRGCIAGDGPEIDSRLIPVYDPVSYTRWK